MGNYRAKFVEMRQERDTERIDFALIRSDEHRAVLEARALMGLLYREAALLEQEALAEGFDVELREWINADQFALKANSREIWVARDRTDVTITYRFFPHAVVRVTTEKLRSVGEEPSDCARRTMSRLNHYLWQQPGGR